MIREEIKKLIRDSVGELQKNGDFPGFEIPEISVEAQKEGKYGDYATNATFQLAKIAKKSPEEMARLIISQFFTPSSILSLKEVEEEGGGEFSLCGDSPLLNPLLLRGGGKVGDVSFFEKVEAIGGFINFFISKEYLQKQVGEILKQKEKFGSLKIGGKTKVNVEFISANPTGPLTLGNGRGGFCGDVLANVLEKAGCKTTMEYYINDTGGQIKKLGHSIIGDSEAVYKGDYIDDLRKEIKGNDPEKIGEKGARLLLKKMIKPTVKKMGIKFDIWFSEKKLAKEVGKTIDFLKDKGLTYEKEGALWFASSKFGDDKDRVLIKEDKEKTYFASDIAYLKNKFSRGFDKLIFFLGADHYGYVARMKAGAEALGHKKEQTDFIVAQLVRLIENGEEVKMSKRSGIYVTIDELIEEVGLDAARFFFLVRSPDTHLDFDLKLAKDKSNKNPVYYIQYAYARICSIIKKCKNQNRICVPTRQAQEVCAYLVGTRVGTRASELNLIKQFIRFPEVIEDTAKDYQIQRIPQYALSLADAFHKFYENCQVITEDRNLTEARLAVVGAAKIVLKNTLDLMGISSPEKM